MPLCMAATTAALRRTTPQSFLARLVADNRIVSERRAVGGGHGTLGRQRYQLTEEEFRSWQRAYEAHGLPGLRATRLQQYRGPRSPRPGRPRRR